MKTINIRLFKVLAVPLLGLAVAVAVVLGMGGSPGAHAQNPASIDFSISAPGSVSVGDNFVVVVNLDISAAPLVDAGDADALAGFTSFQASLTYDGVVVSGISGAGSSEVKGIAGCDIAADVESGLPTAYRAGCATLFSNAMTQQNGPVVNANATCKTAGSGTVTITHGPNLDSFIFDENNTLLSDQINKGAPEVLNIDCVAPVGGLAVDLDGDLGDLPLETASSGGNMGLLAALIAGISAVAITMTGAAWYARRRWAR